jgi:hypothetical protein
MHPDHVDESTKRVAKINMGFKKLSRERERTRAGKGKSWEGKELERERAGCTLL